MLMVLYKELLNTLMAGSQFGLALKNYKNKILFLEKYADEKKVNINREIYNISLRNRILITGDKDNGNNPDTALIGQKNEVFDKILAYRDLRIKEVVLDFISPNIDEILETMEIVGKELIPEL